MNSLKNVLKSCVIKLVLYEDVCMQNKIVFFIVCTVSCLVAVGDEKKTIPATFYGNVPAQVAFDLKNRCKPPVKVKCANCRLLYGAAGNGVRETAKLYAEAQDGFFIEHQFSKLLYNGSRIGSDYIEAVFKDASCKATADRPVVLYISDIDYVEAPPGMNGGRVASNAVELGIACYSCNYIRLAQAGCKTAENLIDEQQKAAIRGREHVISRAQYKAVLEWIYAEIQKKEYEDKVFVIFSTHHLENVHEDFINHLDCTAVNVQTDIYRLLTIFYNILFETNEWAEAARTLKTAQEKVARVCAVANGDKIREMNKLYRQFGKSLDGYIGLQIKNEESWFEQADFRQTENEFMRLTDEIIRVCDAFVLRCDQDLGNTLLTEEKEYYSALKAFCLLLKKAAARRKLLCQDPDLISKIYWRIGTHPTNRYAKQLAQKILQTAYVENGGELTREIVLKCVS